MMILQLCGNHTTPAHRIDVNHESMKPASLTIQQSVDGISLNLAGEIGVIYVLEMSNATVANISAVSEATVMKL